MNDEMKIVNWKSMVRDDQWWIGVDLDGTLVFQDGDYYPYLVGEPVPLMAERVRNWLSKGKKVKIFTARVSPSSGELFGYDVKRVASAVSDWCERQFGQRLEVTHEKDCFLTEFWDDRAITVKFNTGERSFFSPSSGMT
jgi:hypothetical protein